MSQLKWMSIYLWNYYESERRYFLKSVEYFVFLIKIVVKWGNMNEMQ